MVDAKHSKMLGLHRAVQSVKLRYCRDSARRLSGDGRISTQPGHSQITKAARQVVTWKLEGPNGLIMHSEVEPVRSL